MLETDSDQTPVDPTLLADPLKQQKLAESVLSQLGLHPDQQGARSLLDAHFSGPTANPEIKSTVAPLVGDTAPAPKEEIASVPPKPSVAGTPPAAPAAATAITAPMINPAVESSSASPATMAPGTRSAPTIPPPSSGVAPIVGNSNERIEKAQGELGRLIDTGSGISQIKNPFLRGLAKVGNVAADFFTPNLARDIPGTEEHHNQLIRNQESLIGGQEKVKSEEATQAHTEASTENLGDTVKELNEWMKENPDKPITEYWKDKANAANLKLTPQQSVMRYLTMPPEDGGLGMSPDTAFARVNGIINDAKPKTGAQDTQAFESLMSKMSGGQPLDPKLTNDMPGLTKAIGMSKNLTPEEKQNAFAYLISHNTPASSAYAANIRAETMKNMRLFSGIDSQGRPVFVTPEMNEENPGEYMPGTLGEHAMSKGAAFADIDFNMQNVDEALKGLKNGFDPASAAQIAFALRSSDPHSAVATFLTSRVGTALTPDQIDYVTALASLNENALALRSIQGLGQGSDELRAAITRMIPGAGTPSADYAARQMELLKGTVERAKQGIPKSNVKQPPATPAKTTQELHDENQPTQPKTVNRASVEAEVKRLNEINKGNPNWKELTIEDAIADAKKHNITVK